jgi:hypothetical protein
LCARQIFECTPDTFARVSLRTPPFTTPFHIVELSCSAPVFQSDALPSHDTFSAPHSTAIFRSSVLIASFLSTSFSFLQELHTETIDKDAGAIEHLAWSADGSILSACTKHGYFYSFAVLASDSGMWSRLVK